MTDEERELHLVYIKLSQLHFKATGRGDSYEADGYEVLYLDREWYLRTSDGEVLAHKPNWYNLALNCGFTIASFTELDQIRRSHPP